jgi:hypothetical protein
VEPNPAHGGALRRFCRGLALVFALVCPGLARGAEADAYVRLHWLRGASAGSCPEQIEVEQLVRARLGRNPFVSNASRTIDASIDFAGGAWHVELHVRDATGPAQGQRVFDVHADSCAQVADAVGLAVALAIDPNASIASLSPAPAPNESTRDTHGYDHGPGNDRGGGNVAAVPAAPPPTPVRYAYGAPPIQSPPAPTVEPYGAQLTLRGLVAGWLLPGTAPGLGVSGAIGKRIVQVTLGISYFPEASRDSQYSFGLTTIDAGFCGNATNSRWVIAGVCGELHVGAMHSVVVTPLQPTHPGDRPYAALSLGPKIGWRAWAPFYLEGGLSAWASFERPQFTQNEGASTIFESSPIGVVGYLGVGWTTN